MECVIHSFHFTLFLHTIALAILYPNKQLASPPSKYEDKQINTLITFDSLEISLRNAVLFSIEYNKIIVVHKIYRILSLNTRVQAHENKSVTTKLYKIY